MPEDPVTLRDAAGRYRRAVEALGVEWPEPDSGDAAPSQLPGFHDVDAVGQDIAWLHSFLRPEAWNVLPAGGYLLPWPATAAQALTPLKVAWPTPFPWRRQLPIFDFESLLYTVVLDSGEHAGEVWRYEIKADVSAAARAAVSLPALFESWAEVADRGALIVSEHDGCVRLSSGGVRPEVYLRDELGVDPFSYPLAPLSDEATARRQAECGVDPAYVDGEDAWGAWNAHVAEVTATVKRLQA